MAYASVTYTSASGTTFALTNSSGDPIEYLRQSDIAVTVNGILKTLTTDYTFNSAGTAIVLNTAVSGATVVITRTTDIADASVSFTAGSTLTAQDLNNSDKQNRFALQEFSDTYGALTTGSGDLSALAGFIGSSETWLSDNAHAPTTGAVDNRIDSKITTNNALVVLRDGTQAMQAALSLGGFKITNLATPTSGTDASTKAYADSIATNAAADAAAAAASAALANDWATKTSGPVAGGEYSAKYHAQAAATSASNASTSASNASTSATNASNAQTAAEAARDQTLAAYDNFDDRYLGTKTADPTVDNDGNPLVAGALYFNSVAGEMRLWTGTAWVAAYVSGAGFLATTGGTLTGALGVTAGSAGSPSIFISGDTNTGIYSPGADQVAISTNGTQRLTTDTAAVTSTLPVVHPLGAVATPSITFTGDLNTGIYSPGADQVAISTGGTGRLFIDSSGRLLAGTSTARTNFFGTTLSAVTQTEGTGGSAGRGALSVINNDVSNNPPYVLLGRSGAATLGSNAAVVSGSRLGTLTFHGADGTSFIEAATVAGEVDGTPGTNDMPGRLVLSTTSDGASSPTERLRIDSTGRVGIGTTSPSGKLTLSGNAIGTTVALTDAATVAVDLSLANYYTLTLGGSRTLGAPTNQVAGQSGVIVITQDGTGSRTLAYNSVYKFPGGTAPTLTTTANAVDVLVYYVESATRITCRLLSDVK